MGSFEQIYQMRDVLAKDCNDQEIRLFAGVCDKTGLDPSTRQIYAIKRSGKMSIQTSIDGLRLIAERTGKYAGQLGPFWCGEDGEWKDVWLKKEAPLAARVGVLRSDFKEPVWSPARFGDYNAGGPMWSKMGPTMVAKCAEALSLRRAFPQELSGLYTGEEMEQAGFDAHTPANEPFVPDGSRLLQPAEDAIVATVRGMKWTRGMYQKWLKEVFGKNATNELTEKQGEFAYSLLTNFGSPLYDRILGEMKVTP